MIAASIGLLFAIAGFILSVIILITFFVMCYRLGKICDHLAWVSSAMQAYWKHQGIVFDTTVR